jgi:hypothetical protein
MTGTQFLVGAGYFILYFAGTGVPFIRGNAMAV